MLCLVCLCCETGKDGTSRHDYPSGQIVRLPTLKMEPCNNHRLLYTNFQQVTQKEGVTTE